MKYYNCEIRSRIARIEKGDCWWEYSDDENENINSANEIVSLFEKRFVPVIDLFINNHDILETIETSDLDNMYKNFPKKFKGMVFGFSNTRFAWVMVKALEKTNPQKAKEFAKYGLSKLENKSTFFARVDFENLLKESNGA